MNAYERKRAAQIDRNQALLKELGIPHHGQQGREEPPTKRRKKDSRPMQAPSRSSARIAAAAKPSYDESQANREDRILVSGRPPARKIKPISKAEDDASPEPPDGASFPNIEALRSGWSSWSPSAPEPSRDPETGVFHFENHPAFRPNKSPSEVLREGAFGGSYFRPYYSKTLGITVEDDWKELPSDWIDGLDVNTFLTCPDYNPEVNKYRVSAGQSLEAWEAAGWMDHRFDVRGWFQWYCRFFQGRRCEDDARQISRWGKCVGETGRWRRILLKRYVTMGIRDVADEGNDDEGRDVSPVVHQTCHHWAWEVRQEVLERWWAEGR